MSVTFEPAHTESDQVGWNVTHYVDNGDEWVCEVVSGPYESYRLAEQALLEHNVRCELTDCAAYGGGTEMVLAAEMADAPSINLSNANAAFVLETLGLLAHYENGDVDLSGECSGEDFLGRVLVADALSPVDEGVPAYDASVADSGRFIECGRRPSYLQSRLDSLREVAEFCRTYGREVTWG